MKNFFDFDFSHFRGDLFGGVTAGVVALPLALAFGLSSGLGPSAGLYGAIFISFFAALFGGTNTQISGPTAPMTALSIIVVAGIVASFDGEVEKALPAILTVFLLAGLIQIGLGLIGVGKYIRYMPYPVVSGFMTAIGVIILVTQILPAVGYYPKTDTVFVDQFKEQAKEVILQNYIKDAKGEDFLLVDDLTAAVNRAPEITPALIEKEAKTIAGREASGVLGAFKVMGRAFKNINWLELCLALATIFIIFGFKKITTAIPSTLVALVVMSGIAIIGKLDYLPIPKIPQGLPVPRLEIFTSFDLAAITPYILTALLLAVLGAIDSLLTSLVADNMTKTQHSPNRELVGQGIGNTIASIFGGIPGAGATIRTVVNIKAGGKTRLSGMIAGILLLVIMLAFAPIASKIPAAVLAGILITVGINVMDYKGLKAVPHMPKEEVFIMLFVLILSSVWNLVYAVGIGLLIASVIFMKKIGDQAAANSKVMTLKQEPIWSDERNFPENFKNDVFIKHLDGPLFFGSTSQFTQVANQIDDVASAVIVRMDKVPYIDQTGLYAMEDVFFNLVSSNKKVLLTGLNEQPQYMMEKIDIIPDLVPKEHIFDDMSTCIDWVVANVEDR